MSHYFHRKISHQNSCKYLVIESSLPAVTGQSRMQITTFIGSNFSATQHNRALEAAFRRAGLDDISAHNLRKPFATRLLSRGAAITVVQHLRSHASVKTTEKAYAAFVRNERFKQTIDLLDTPVVTRLKVVR